MADIHRISIAKEFTRTPAGRYRTDGPNSGQRFREEFLVPSLRAGETIELDLDGVVSLPSSFWEEATGGLVRSGIGRDVLQKQLKIKTTDPLLKIFEELAFRFIQEAADTLH